MEHSRQFITQVFAIVVAASSFALADQPPPSPTPKPGTLASIASGRSLIRSGEAGQPAPIVITNDNLATLGEGAAVTLVVATSTGDPEPPTETGVDPKTRNKWRRKVVTQSGIIARVEAKRATIETEINRLERGKLDTKTLDRIAKTEERLAAVESELQREKAELSRIIRAARRDGAQPGWFR